MPTRKKRINLIVPDDINKAVTKLAKRDQTSLSSKTIDLIRKALEIEEDAELLGVVYEREVGVNKADYLKHDSVWG